MTTVKRCLFLFVVLISFFSNNCSVGDNVQIKNENPDSGLQREENSVFEEKNRNERIIQAENGETGFYCKTDIDCIFHGVNSGHRAMTCTNDVCQFVKCKSKFDCPSEGNPVSCVENYCLRCDNNCNSSSCAATERCSSYGYKGMCRACFP